MAAKKTEHLTLKEALELLNEVHNIDPEVHGKPVYQKQTLYNAISDGRLKRYGPHHIAKVDKEELLRVFGPKKAG